MFALISNIFGYLLNLLYGLLNNNFGFAIIIFSILLRLILLPITIKQQRSMKKTTEIQGELRKLQIKYKNNPEMLNKETLELYKREKISPFSGCLSAIVQIVVILSVFYLVSQPLTYMKKANDSNPELKTVVEEYKKEISESNNNRTRYLEIATIARIREDYKDISNKLNEKNNESNENTINEEPENNVENTVGEDIVQNEQNVDNTENTTTDEIVQNEQNTDNTENATTDETVQNEQNIDNTENTINEENSEEINNTEVTEGNVDNIENKEELEKRKSILEKLNINMDFLGLDLSKVPNENLNDYKVYIIPLLYVISSFISIKLTTNMQNNEKKENENK